MQDQMHAAAFGDDVVCGEFDDVQAHPTPILLLDHRDRLAELGGANRGDVPSRTCPEDDNVEIGVGGTHGTPSRQDRYGEGLAGEASEG